MAGACWSGPTWPPNSSPRTRRGRKTANRLAVKLRRTVAPGNDRSGGVALPPAEDQHDSPTEETVPQSRRFFAKATRSPRPASVGDAGKIAEEVVQHLAGLVGAEVEITLEIHGVTARRRSPAGPPDGDGELPHPEVQGLRVRGRVKQPRTGTGSRAFQEEAGRTAGDAFFLSVFTVTSTTSCRKAGESAGEPGCCLAPQTGSRDGARYSRACCASVRVPRRPGRPPSSRPPV